MVPDAERPFAGGRGDKRLLRGPVRLWIAAGHHRSVVVSPLERALGAVRFGLVLWRAKSEWGRRPRATRQAQVSASQTIRIMRSHLDRRGGGGSRLVGCGPNDCERGEQKLDRSTNESEPQLAG